MCVGVCGGGRVCVCGCVEGGVGRDDTRRIYVLEGRDGVWTCQGM